MNTEHTPGPWRTSQDAVPDWHVQITVYAEADGQRVATVFRDKANAELIARAPELLEENEKLREALTNLLSQVEDREQGNDDLKEELDAAVAALQITSKCAVRLTSPSEWIIPAERAALAVSTRLYQAERDVPKVPLKPGELATLIEAEYAPVISGLEAMNRRTLATNTKLREALELAQATIERLAEKHGPFTSAQGTVEVINAALAL